MQKTMENTECQQRVLGCRILSGRPPSLQLELRNQHSVSAGYPDWKGRDPKYKL